MTLSRRWWALWVSVLGAPVAAFVLLLAVPAWDRSFGTFSFHFWAVSGTTLAAGVASLLVASLMRAIRETRLVFLALAFLSIAAIFAVHGLDTPGHIHDELHPELLVSGWLSIFAGALFVVLSAIELPERADRWLQRNGLALLRGVALALGTYMALALVAPGWLSWVPIADRNLQLALAAVTMALLAFAAWRYFQAFLFARLPSQWAMVAALVLLMEAQASMAWGRFWHYSWWGYHGAYAVAFVVLFAGWGIEVKRAGNVRVLAEALSMRDAMAQLNRGHDRRIAELVDAIELKDLYTLGHVRRVAGYALMIGKEMGLSPRRQRDLVLAAQMHDVGKIGVPDRILTKPGPLTSEEFAVIKEHVDRGFEIARRVPVLQPCAAAIRHHHEKVDGSGYPEGLRGDAIPLDARIVAVADAFDAMTSGRVYQPAVGEAAALAELERCRGSHFDAACVEAFRRARSKSAGAAQAPKPALDAGPAAA